MYSGDKTKGKRVALTSRRWFRCVCALGLIAAVLWFVRNRDDVTNPIDGHDHLGGGGGIEAPRTRAPKRPDDIRPPDPIMPPKQEEVRKPKQEVRPPQGHELNQQAGNQPAPAQKEVNPNVPAVPPANANEAKAVMKASELKITPDELDYVKKNGFNLRGMRCHVRPENGKVGCFQEDLHGRTYCPDFANPAYLSMAPQQHSCQPGAMDGYCTAKCQEDNEEVKWMAWHNEYCDVHPADCPKKPEIIPFEKYETEAFVPDPYRKAKPCDKRGVSPYSPLFKDVTIGILTREIKDDHATIAGSLKSWANGGLLEAVGEVILFVNQRDHSLDSLFEPYTKAPYNVKIMGDSVNNGIGRCYDWLVGNATKKYFVFLEKDFLLVEPRPCWQEQLEAGIDILNNDKAHVVRQRSRFNPGRPLWALVLYVGKEESVLQRQPDLLCYQYHWLEDPMIKWPKPEHFIKLKDTPPFWGSDSRFCGWTNNVHMIKTKFWIDNFRPSLSRLADGVWGLEGFMNSNDQAWHGRNFIVALGDGMFAHVDRNNFG